MFIFPPPPCIPFCIPLYTFLYALHTPAVYLSLEIHTNPHNLCTVSHLNHQHQHHDLVSSYIALWAMAGVLLGSDKLIAHQLICISDLLSTYKYKRQSRVLLLSSFLSFEAELVRLWILSSSFFILSVKKLKWEMHQEIWPTSWMVPIQSRVAKT